MHTLSSSSTSMSPISKLWMALTAEPPLSINQTIVLVRTKTFLVEGRATQHTHGANTLDREPLRTLQAGVGVQAAPRVEEPLLGGLLSGSSEVFVILTQRMLNILWSLLPDQKVRELKTQSFESIIHDLGHTLGQWEYISFRF